MRARTGCCRLVFNGAARRGGSTQVMHLARPARLRVLLVLATANAATADILGFSFSPKPSPASVQVLVRNQLYCCPASSGLGRVC